MGKQRIFADGMDSVSYAEGMIRMELYNIDSGSSEKPAPHEQFAELIMNPAGFIRAYAAMENLMNQLADAGVVKRNKQREQSQTVNTPQAAAPSISEISPNFK